MAEKQEDKEISKTKICTHIKKTTKTKTFKVADKNNVKIVDETIFLSFYDSGDKKIKMTKTLTKILGAMKGFSDILT